MAVDNSILVLIAVVVIIILYLLLSSNADKDFITSVETAKSTCATAVTSQTEDDFKLAIDAIAAAKTARSASLNQYADSSAIPAEVNTASVALDSIMCGNHILDSLAIQAVSVASAACDAANKSKLPADITTAKNAMDLAQNSIDKALAQYKSTNYVTTALSASVAKFKTLSLPLLVTVNKSVTHLVLTKDSTWPTYPLTRGSGGGYAEDANQINLGKIECYTVDGLLLPPSAYTGDNVAIVTSMGVYGTGNTLPTSMTITLAAPTQLSKVVIRTRQDCCWQRLNGTLLEIKNGSTVLKSVRLTDADNQVITL